MVRNRTILRSRGHVTTSGDVFGCHTGGVPLASEAGTPLSTLQYTGQRPLQSCLTQTANGVEAENPCSKRMKSVRVRVCVCKRARHVDKVSSRALRCFQASERGWSGRHFRTRCVGVRTAKGTNQFNFAFCV